MRGGGGEILVHQDVARAQVHERAHGLGEGPVVGVGRVAGDDVVIGCALLLRDRTVMSVRELVRIRQLLPGDLSPAAIESDGVLGFRPLDPPLPMIGVVAVVVGVVARFDRQPLAARVDDEGVLVGGLVVVRAERPRARLEIYGGAVEVGQVAVHRDPAGRRQVERVGRSRREGRRRTRVRRRHQVLDARGIFADQSRGVPAAQRTRCEVDIALDEARALLEEWSFREPVAEEADRGTGIRSSGAGVVRCVSQRHEIGEELPVIPHPCLLREIDSGGPAQRVPGTQRRADVKHAVGSAVGIAAFLAAPRARHVKSERQQALHPGGRLRKVADEQRGHRRQHSGRDVAMGVARLLPERRLYFRARIVEGELAGADEPVIKVADARAQIRKNLVLLRLSQHGSEPIVAECDDPRDIERFLVVDRGRAARVPRREVQHAPLRVLLEGVRPVVRVRHERPQRLHAVAAVLGRSIALLSAERQLLE